MPSSFAQKKPLSAYIKTRNQELKEHWRTDIVSGFVLFLIALPLSVGIAIASGAPPTAGLLAAIVGGILGSLLGSGHVTINGPAAGLIVVVLNSIQVLGHGDPGTGFRLTLAAICMAGVLQILMGVFRLGTLALAAPSSVIHGMLAAIGIIIATKQLPVLLGVQPEAKSIFGLFGEIPSIIAHLNPEIALVGICSLLIVILLPRWMPKSSKILPAPLAAVIVGIVLGKLFDFEHPHAYHLGLTNYMIGPKVLLNIPQNFSDSFISPEFGHFLSADILKMAITICLVASIESVLSAFAVDKLDPWKRRSDLNRELWSKGICNFILGMIGGLPIISEIVRSSANVSSGARTRWANFFHGVFILIFVILFPTVLHMIPLASLAAILIVVGIRLANPKELIHVSKIGWDQIALFLATLLTTLATDLLVGVLVGFFLKLFLHLFRGAGVRNLFRAQVKVTNNGNEAVLSIRGSAVFCNFPSLKHRLEALRQTKNVRIDLSEAVLVDHTVMEHLEYFKEECRREGTQVSIAFSDEHQMTSLHPLASRRRRLV